MTRPTIQHLRRRAKAIGVRFTKSNRQTVSLDDLGEYMVIDVSTNSVISGNRYNCDTEDVARLIEEMEAENLATSIEKKGPAEAATSPSHGSINPEKD